MKKEQRHRYKKALKSARLLAADLAKYAVPVESGPRKKVLRHVNPLNLPDDGSYGSNYGVVS
jgi:hypothetical protein